MVKRKIKGSFAAIYDLKSKKHFITKKQLDKTFLGDEKVAKKEGFHLLKRKRR